MKIGTRLPDHPGLTEYQRQMDKEDHFERAWEQMQDALLQEKVGDVCDRLDRLHADEARQALRAFVEGISCAAAALARHEKNEPDYHAEMCGAYCSGDPD